MPFASNEAALQACQGTQVVGTVQGGAMCCPGIKLIGISWATSFKSQFDSKVHPKMTIEHEIHEVKGERSVPKFSDQSSRRELNWFLSRHLPDDRTGVSSHSLLFGWQNMI